MVANFVAHSSHLHLRSEGMTVVRSDDLVIADGDVGDDTFNIIARARFSEDDADDRIAETVSAVDGAFSWWVDPTSTPGSLSERIAVAGYPAHDPEPGMVATLSALPEPTVPDGLEIRQVTTPDELADYALVLAANWDPPAPGVVRFYSRVAKAALDPECQARYFVGCYDGAAVCAAEAFLAHEVAGLYNVSTLVSHRRRGFGRAITLAALHAARAEGFGTAVLQASPDGQPIYRALGFADLGTFTEHSVTGCRRSAP
ncbi:acetyltransferase [Kibdelosporangium phytohabitans]|uniref:Acetyltransferase n=2 Tax=Kibdelosporangium phytohabitans TaxID=860235 RepID=A0A0N9HSJ0_9PSEU|nr:acetyltransferase [Kibdelosporangium phytohabitans]